MLGDVAAVERLDQLGLDQLAQHVHGHAHEHVERQPAAQLGHGLVHRVERGHLDLAVVLLGEVVQAGLVDVGDPVGHREGGPGLGLQAGGDRLVLAEGGPPDGIVRARQRYLARAGQGGCAGVQPGAAADGGQAGPVPFRKPRRENSGGRDPSFGQPSRGCTSSLLPPGRSIGKVKRTERSVNNRYYCDSIGARPSRQKGHPAGETRPKPPRSAFTQRAVRPSRPSDVRSWTPAGQCRLRRAGPR